GLSSGGQRSDFSRFADPERLRGPDRLANVAAGEVTVMLLDHAGVSMPEIPRHDHQGNAVHDHQRRIGVAQGVKRRGRGDLAGAAGFGERPLLVRLTPSGAVSVKQELAAGAARGDLSEEIESFGRKLDVANLPSLGRANEHRPTVAVEIDDVETGEFAVS